MSAYAIRWAIDVADENDSYHREMVTAARAELADLEAVVAAQREALRAIHDASLTLTDLADFRSEVERFARAALDAEGVSEPEGNSAVERHPPGSLTSPVDRDVCECGHGKSAHPYVGRIASWPTRCMYCVCRMFVPVATSPVDTAPGAKP